MWRRVHILSSVQSLVLASASAALIALPLALRSATRDETAILRNFFWPDAFYPYLTFSLVFLGVLIALLGYYHLGRLGLLLSTAAGFALAWVMSVACILCFWGVGQYFNSAWPSIFAYVVCVVLVYVAVTTIHFKAADSAFVRDAQRKLRLFRAVTV